VCAPSGLEGRLAGWLEARQDEARLDGRLHGALPPLAPLPLAPLPPTTLTLDTEQLEDE